MKNILGAMGGLYQFHAPRLVIDEKMNNSKNPPKKEYWWRIWMSSDIVAASSEGYESREKCLDNLKKIEQHIKYLRENNLIK